MIRAIFTLCLLLSVSILRAGCSAFSSLSVNNTPVFYCGGGDPANSTAAPRWVDKCYVDDIHGNIVDVHANIHFQPGDSVYLYGVGIITQPGTYSAYHDVCYGNWAYTDYFICSYLSDTLEIYYKYHFDHHFIDSLAAVKLAFYDSTATAKIAFDDSVAAVPAVFYPNPFKEVVAFECFKTVQDPFDFRIFDLQGRCILTKRVEFSDSYQSISVDMSSLQSGTYIAQYFMNNQRYTRQIVKM